MGAAKRTSIFIELIDEMHKIIDKRRGRRESK
jgi:hypothetical protein